MMSYIATAWVVFSLTLAFVYADIELHNGRGWRDRDFCGGPSLRWEVVILALIAPICIVLAVILAVTGKRLS